MDHCIHEVNYNLINQNIKKDIERWSTHPLDFSSKISVIKEHFA